MDCPICGNKACGRLWEYTIEKAILGLDVTAIVRRDNATVAQEVLRKDLYDLCVAIVREG